MAKNGFRFKARYDYSSSSKNAGDWQLKFLANFCHRSKKKEKRLTEAEDESYTFLIYAVNF